MSRFRRSTNDLADYDDLAYGDAPNRWDRDRFETVRLRETDRPGRTDIRITDRIDARGPSGRYQERDYIEEERYGSAARLPSRPRRSDRELFGDQDPRYIAQTALQPYRKREDIERDELILDIERRRVRDDYGAPTPRPGLLRRQSSLDTFDRRPARRYEDDYRLPPNVDIPLPRAPPPRRMREEELEEFRYPDYRDVEIVREREVRRNRAPSDTRSRKSKAKSRKSARSVATSKSSTVSDTSSESSSSSETVSRATSPSPERKVGKKGRTRMPKRLVKRQVIIALNYPFVEEDDFIVVTRALDKDRIDEVIRLSEEYREPKTQVYRYDEAAAPPNEHYEALRTEWINPPSIRAPSVRAPSPARTARRKPSPSRTVRTARSRSRAPSPPRPVREEIIIREQVPAPPQIIREPAPPQQPLTIFLPERGRERSEAELKAEIRALEAEQRALRYERQSDRREIIVRERPEEDYQVVEYRPRQERREVEYVERERSPKREVVRVEKDRKGRKGPNPKLVAAMMATLT